MDYIPPFGGDPEDVFVNRNPGTGTPGSKVPAQFFNDIQAELLNLFDEAGIVPSSADLTQLTQAIQAVAGFSINTLAEDVTPDILADFLATYDADGAVNKKVLLSTILTRFMAAYMTIAADADWDAVLTPGMFTTTGATYSNAPSEYAAWPGTLWVIGRSTNANHKTQMFFYSAASPEIWSRTTTDAGDTWSAWRRVTQFIPLTVRATYELPKGTSGPTYSASAGAFQTIALNTLAKNEGSIASLSSNRISLPAGKYRVFAQFRMYGVTANFRIIKRIQDITNGVTLAKGASEFLSSNTAGSDSFELYDTFELANAADIELQFVYPGTTGSTAAPIAVDDTAGGAEIYNILHIERIA